MSFPPPSIHDEGVEELCPVSTVYNFGVGKFIENLAVRHSGKILVNVHNTNELMEIDPNAKTEPKVVHKFPTNLFGIVEVGKDIFYVSSGSIGQPGTFAIYKVDMSTSRSASVSKLVDIPEAIFLNGSTLLKPNGNIILAADSILGAVFAIDTKAATSKQWLQDKALMKVSDNPNYPGVNGIKMHKGSLYLSNTEAKTFLKAAVTESGDAVGSLEQVYDRCNVDDFAFDSEDTVYLTSHVFNSVFKIRSNGVRSRVAGGPEDTTVAGSTSAAFGRTSKDSKTLYVPTNGGMSNPVHGKVGDARLLAIEVGVSGASN